MSVLEQTNQDLADVKDLLENKEKLNNIKINATINTPSLTIATATFQKKYFDNVLDKISIQNYTLLKTESLQQDFYKQLNKFVKDSKFVISEIEKLDNVITELGNVGGFSDEYLKDFSKGVSDNYFDFIENYNLSINSNQTSILNNDFSIIESKKRSLPLFDKTIVGKNYCLDFTNLFQEKYDYISTASFVTQNLINLYRSYNYFYPNCISSKVANSILPSTELIDLLRLTFLDKVHENFNDDFFNVVNPYKLRGEEVRLSILNLHKNNIQEFYLTEFFNDKNKNNFYVKVDGLDDQITNKEYSILDSINFNSINLGNSNSINFENYIENEQLSGDIPLNCDVKEISIEDENNILYYRYNNFYPSIYEYKHAYRIYAKRKENSDISFDINNLEVPESLLASNRNFFSDVHYNKNSAVHKNIIRDGLYENIEDKFIEKYYFNNSSKMFNYASDFFNVIDNNSYKYFEYDISYNIKNRYMFYKEKYANLINIDVNNVNELSHISIKSSSRGAFIVPKPITTNTNKIILKNKKDESFLNKKTYQYKIAINKCLNKYYNLKLKDNLFYNKIKEKFEDINLFYNEKDNNNTVSLVYNKEKGILRKKSNDFIISTIDDEVYLNIDKNSNIYSLNSAIKKISKNNTGFTVTNEDINDFKKKALSNNFLKNRVSLNKRIFKDINDIFKNFREEFLKDYQTSAFDKLLTSLFSNDDTLNSSENKEVVKLLLACALLKKNNIELNYMSGESDKKDVEDLEKYLEFKKLSKHIFSLKNINYQEKYILESNVLGHFLDKTELNEDVLNDYKLWKFGTRPTIGSLWNESPIDDNQPQPFMPTEGQIPDLNNGKNTLNISKRICNSIALCFPYNTINNFGTAKTLDHTRNLPVYYDYGRRIGSSFQKTKEALAGGVKEKIITFSKPDASTLNSLNLPQPIVHRKVNTIDSFKNNISSIEHSKQHEDECFTIAMHYLWDKNFDYKDITLLDGTKINDIDEFISCFSKKNKLPEFSSTWENLKDTSSYPLHEMFYVNRVLKNKFFDNVKNKSSVINKIIEFIIDSLYSIDNYNTENIDSISSSLKFIEENEELLDLIFDASYCYSSVYEEYYNKFIESYFQCIQEIPFIKDSVYDLSTYPEYSGQKTNIMLYYSFTADLSNIISKTKDQHITLSDTGLYYRVSDNFNINDRESLDLRIFVFDDDEKLNFYSSFAESLLDNTLSISYVHDKKYMFQENASLYFNRKNRISMDSENKALSYVNANDYLEKCLNIVEIAMRENYIENIDNININDELDNNDFNKNTTLSMFKDIHESLRKLDLNVGLSFDILIGYTRRLIEFNELITKYKRGITKTENILNEVKSEFDDTEVTVLESMLNDVYRNKLKQNVCYLNDYIKNVEKSIYLKDKTVEEVTEQFDITHFEKIKYDNSIKYIKEYPKTSTNNDIIILKFNEELIKTITNSTLIKFLVTKTYFNSDEEEIYEFYYSPIITHFEFLKTKETYNSIGYIDLQEKSIENSYKILTREKFLENYKDILNIEDEEIANSLFNTYQDSNFCKASLNLCLGTNIKDGLHNTDDFISIDTVGLIENVEEFNLNKTFKVNSFPFEEIQEFSGEVYNNVSNKFDNSKNSFIRKHLSCISKFNSNIQIQQMLSNNNVDDYIAFNLVRPFSNIDSGLFNYTIQAEEIF